MNTPLTSAEIKAQKQKRRKKKLSLISTLAVIGVILFFVYALYGPKYGNMYYGVCRVFVERYVDFPHTIKVRDVEYYGVNARIFISHLDASGQFNYNMFECEYEKLDFNISRIRIDRKIISDLDSDAPINPALLYNFNKGLTAILANPPNLRIPRTRFNANLVDLWIGDGG